MKPGIATFGLLALLGLSGCGALPPAGPPATAAQAAAASTAPAAIQDETSGSRPTVPPEPVKKGDGAEAALPGPAEAPAVAENSIFFAPSRAEVDEDGRRKLQQHAQRLKDNPKLQLTLVGHTDDLGSRAYNLAIVEQRIDAVYRLLRGLGVPVRQLRRYAVGAERPGKACRTPECRRNMRRVELQYRK